jgi:hypothetical protein
MSPTLAAATRLAVLLVVPGAAAEGVLTTAITTALAMLSAHFRSSHFLSKKRRCRIRNNNDFRVSTARSHTISFPTLSRESNSKTLTQEFVHTFIANVNEKYDASKSSNPQNIFVDKL